MGMVRVAVVYFSKSTKTISDQAKALAASIEARGAQVDLIDGSKTHDAKLTGHHFLAIGCDVRSLFKGTLPRELKGFLANSGLISGKRSMAWVSSAPLGAQRTLLGFSASTTLPDQELGAYPQPSFSPSIWATPKRSTRIGATSRVGASPKKSSWPRSRKSAARATGGGLSLARGYT